MWSSENSGRSTLDRQGGWVYNADYMFQNLPLSPIKIFVLFLNKVSYYWIELMIKRGGSIDESAI